MRRKPLWGNDEEFYLHHPNARPFTGTPLTHEEEVAILAAIRATYIPKETPMEPTIKERAKVLRGLALLNAQQGQYYGHVVSPNGEIVNFHLFVESVDAFHWLANIRRDCPKFRFFLKKYKIRENKQFAANVVGGIARKWRRTRWHGNQGGDTWMRLDFP